MRLIVPIRTSCPPGADEIARVCPSDSVMAAEAPWCRVSVTLRDGTWIGDYVVAGDGSPTLAAVDSLARLALAAKRLDAALRLVEISPQMWQLLELSGLSVEMQWKTELGEEPLGIHHREEEAHRRDLPA
jgi:hypothetical protein